MQKSERLFDLIHSMTKAEKRAFKLRAQRNGERNRYIDLFDVIAAMPAYDEEELKSRVRDAGTRKNLRQAKHYLKNAVLRCLTELRVFQDSLRVADSMLSTASMLHERQMHDLEYEILCKAEKMARVNGNEMTALRSRMLQMTVLPIIENDAEVLRASLDSSYEDMKRDLERIRTMVDYRWVQSAIVILFDTIGTPRSERELQEFHRIARHPSMLQARFLDNPQNAVMYYDAAYNYHMVMRNFAAAEQSSILMLNAIKGNDYYTIMRSRCLLRLAQAYSSMLDYEKFTHCWTDALFSEEGPPDKHLLDETHHFFDVFHIKLLSRMGRFKDAYTVYKRAPKNINSLALGKSETAFSIYAYFYACFGCGHYNEAFKWLQKITDDPSLTTRNDIAGFAHIAKLITHYELGDLSAMDYILRSTYRFLRSRQGIYQVEELVLTFISGLTGVRNSDELLLHFRRALDKLRSIADDPMEDQILDLFELQEWLQSRIERRPFADVVRESAAVQRARHMREYEENMARMLRPDGNIGLFDHLHSAQDVEAAMRSAGIDSTPRPADASA